MNIEQALKNVLALLDKILIPGSESVKMTAVKNDIAVVANRAREMQEELDASRQEAERMAHLYEEKEEKADAD